MALAPRTSFCYSHIQIRIPSSSSVKMANSHSPNYATSSKTMGSMRENRRLPILLFDVMDTIVRDPFYQDVPAFFRMPFKKLLNEKHPKAWIEFEEGLINEKKKMPLQNMLTVAVGSLEYHVKVVELRPWTLQELFLLFKYLVFWRSWLRSSSKMEGILICKECMKNGYSYLEGMESLLCHLKHNGYMLIEEKLKLSAYISWSFCSCEIGKFFLRGRHHFSIICRVIRCNIFLFQHHL
ncbi:uncharacterized protein LOC18441834 isoform X2 [Amborella trichopoda]|uniref:uncharacterized protein LOC18441834 isoform X2 n=1 Tax=Amborella trichopoda TaxID=13333 RepID=UPI0009C02655|nr:uncharacterized protein LOC18441834 isoform X2 [Amborella trichopoda]|eukprot:XP_020527671.1 uncharacterized protein LOC18441834 isoform X2 [Amborella trichopoda]